MPDSYRNSDPRPPIMQGSPVPPEWRVPPLDWDAPPWNRWAFQHMRELVTTVDVPRGGDAWEMPTRVSDVSAIACETADGRASTYGAMLDETYADGALIWLDGTIIAEDYANAMTAATPHIAFSVSKSVVATAAGILIGEGLMDPAAPIVDYVPELSATGWNGATLQHVLDMTSGVKFDETYGGPDADILFLDVAANLKPPSPHMDPARIPACLWDQMMGLTVQEAEHGARFEYRSIETECLGYAMERASGMRLADLISDRLWAPLGAERDAFFTVDRAGFALADGGFNATLRDFARFGRLCLEDGRRDGRQVIPRDWVEDVRGGAHGLTNGHVQEMLPGGRYRNQFWIEADGRPAHLSLGIFGQHIYVDPQIGLVAAKLSSWPDFVTREHLIDWLRAVKAVAAAHR
ncbi:MAG: serine hydrolase [Pseudomonadota bacterium]